MDLSAIIVMIVLSALFFGFIVWMAVISRRPEAEETASLETGERKLKK